MAMDSRTGSLEAEGYNFGGQIYENVDAEARERITALEEKVRQLEARRQIFVGTQEEINTLAESEAIRIGDLAFTTDDETATAQEV